MPRSVLLFLPLPEGVTGNRSVAPEEGSSRGERLRAVLALALLTWAPGCSYAFVRGPSAMPQHEWGVERHAPPSGDACTTSNVAPILDTILAVPLIAAGGVAVAGASEGSKGCTGTCTFNSQFGTPAEWAAIGAGALALGTLAIASAATGYGRTADCRELQEQLPGPPHRSARYLLDVSAIADARARPQDAPAAPVH